MTWILVVLGGGLLIEWLLHGQRKARKSRADLLRRLRAGRTHLIATAA